MTPGLRAAACLSLSGRFARFGRQAEQGLRLWADDRRIHLTVLDDLSSPPIVAQRLPLLAQHADLLFGPYSTVLMKAAAPIADGHGHLLFNHGGSGGSLNRPGSVVNVLTPADRYAGPFVRFLADAGGSHLFTTRGKGVFGRDVVAGAAATADDCGIPTAPLDWQQPPAGDWVLLSAGVYEDDIAAVRRARDLPNPPRLICSVAAGVTSFPADSGIGDGVYGIGQWVPGSDTDVDAGLDAGEFLARWRHRYGGVPDYPGVQAYAAGVVASLAADTTGTTERDALWQAVAGLDVRTVFGRFRIDPETGVQTGHAAALSRWSQGVQVPIG